MEYGIKICGIEQLNGLEQLKNLDRYRYIYFGNEFCDKKIPSGQFCREVVQYCLENSKIPVFLTPYLTDVGISILKKRIDDIYSIHKEFEITINDYGILEFLKGYPEVRINMGRMLIKMKKGPEIMSGVLDKDPLGFRQTSLSSIFIDFAKASNITRFEMDIPPQGLVLPDSNNISLYLGNCIIASTRRCPYIDADKKDFRYEIKGCKKECMNYCIAKNTRFYDKLIYVLGNSEFLRTDKAIDPDLKDKFDRIVIFRKIIDVL